MFSNRIEFVMVNRIGLIIFRFKKFEDATWTLSTNFTSLILYEIRP